MFRYKSQNVTLCVILRCPFFSLSLSLLHLECVLGSFLPYIYKSFVFFPPEYRTPQVLMIFLSRWDTLQFLVEEQQASVWYFHTYVVSSAKKRKYQISIHSNKIEISLALTMMMMMMMFVGSGSIWCQQQLFVWIYIHPNVF